MNKLNIKIEGRANSGKTTIMNLIYKTLREEGFDVKIAPSLDYSNINEFNKQANRNFDLKIETIKNTTEIILDQIQLKR